MVSCDPPRCGEDERSIPPRQLGESELIPLLKILRQEFLIGFHKRLREDVMRHRSRDVVNKPTVDGQPPNKNGLIFSLDPMNC